MGLLFGEAGVVLKLENVTVGMAVVVWIGLVPIAADVCSVVGFSDIGIFVEMVLLACVGVDEV